MARKPKLTKALIDEIVTYKENGLSNKDICDMAGIDESTLYGWLQEAETGKNRDDESKKASNLELKVELSEGLKRASAAFKAFHIQNITKAAKKEWQASAWMLERMFPKEFGRIDRQVAIIGDGPKSNGMLDEILDYFKLGERDVQSDS